MSDELNKQSNDTIVEESKMLTLVDQMGENLLEFRVEGIFKNSKEDDFRNRLNLHKTPPTMIIVDETGSEVEFKLTQEMTSSMIKTLKEVQRAYAGLSPTKELKHINLEELPNFALNVVINNPLKSLMFTALIIVTIRAILG